VEILNLLDDHARLLVASHARTTTKAADVVATFHQAAAAHGFPASVLADNGAIFTAAPRGGGRCAIELELARLGIAPASAYAARPTATPAAPGLTVPAHYRVRRDRVDHTGVITLRHNSRLHHIGLGRRHAGVRVLVLVADLEIRVLTQDGQLLRALTLDPSRDYQPQPKT
jgi:hypothetical protein